MVRSRESPVFKTGSINHSDTSPQWQGDASAILAWVGANVKRPAPRRGKKSPGAAGNGAFPAAPGLRLPYRRPLRR